MPTKKKNLVPQAADQGVSVAHTDDGVSEGVLRFWFEELRPEQWFAKDRGLDLLIARRYRGLLDSAREGGLAEWRAKARGRLAEIIVLDQFSRSIYRDRPEAFAADALALRLARDMLARGSDKALTFVERHFAYMPFMHSESLHAHETAVALFVGLGDERSLEFERRHKAIIEQFGRFPHRNRALSRPSTAAETTYLQTSGESSH